MKYKKTAYLFMAFIFLITVNSKPVIAMEEVTLTENGNFSIDETLYINMDYFGNTESISVVKGVTPYKTGNQTYIDYGEYLSVTNMSSSFLPIIQNTTVKWDIPADTEKFYFEGYMDETSFILPWDVDITYKLNGSPVDPSTLAGAKGLIEIRVQGEPNDKTSDYIKNNMMMEILYIPDIDHTKQISVDGSMVQTIGGMQVAAYMVLPDSDFDVTFEVVSHSYESTGLQMMLQPITIDTLDIIQDAKDTQDDMKVSMDLLYDSLDATLASIIETTGSIGSMQSALYEIDQVHDTLSSYSDDLDNTSAETIEGLTALSESTKNSATHIVKAQDTLTNMMVEVNQLNGSMGQMKGNLTDLLDNISDVNDDLNEIEELLNDLESNSNDLTDDLSSLQDRLDSIKDSLDDMDEPTSDLRTSILALSNDIGDISDDIAQLSSSPSVEITTTAAMLIESIYPALGSTTDLLDDTAALITYSDDILSVSDKTIDTIDDMCTTLQETIAIMNDGTSLATEDIESLKVTNDIVIDTLTTSTVMIEDINSLMTFITDQEEKALDALDDIDTLMDTSTELLDTATKSFQLLDEIADNSRDNIDSGSERLLSSTQSLLNDSLGIINNTEAIRSASALLKSDYDKQRDELDDDLGFLFNMDPDATKVSFTSTKNSEPNTLQVVIRTAEISLEEEEKVIERLDIEEKEDIGFWQRTLNLLTALFAAVGDVFKANNE